MIVLWIFLTLGGWTTLETYDTLAECKRDQWRIYQAKDAGNPIAAPVVSAICLPAGAVPR